MCGAARCVGLAAAHQYFIHVRETTAPCRALLVRVDTEDALRVHLNQVVSAREV